MSASRATIPSRSIARRQLGLALLTLGWLAPALAAAERTRATFPLSDVDHPVVTLDLPAGQLRLLVNTGVPRTVIDARFRGLLGKAKASTAARRPYTTHEHVKADLGGLDFAPAEVLCVDLGELVAGEGVDGFLGMDFLARYTIDFDWDEGQLVIARGGPQVKAGRGVQIDLTYDAETIPRAQATINGHACPLALDTGWIGPLTLSPADERAVFRDGPPRSVSEYGMTARGILQSRMTRVESLELAGVRAQDVLCSIGLPEPAQTRLGSYFLRQYRAIFDFPHDRLVLIPRARSTPGEADMSGIHLMRRRGRTIVYAIDEDSPAAAAGIVGGDQIVAVDDVAAANLTPAQLRELLRSGDGERLEIKCIHLGSERSIELALRKRI